MSTPSHVLGRTNAMGTILTEKQELHDMSSSIRSVPLKAKKQPSVLKKNTEYNVLDFQ
jgi:hypothetical protein